MIHYTDDFLKNNHGFDLYGRHQITRLVTDILRQVTNKKSLKILDVGGLDGYLHKFLPHDAITIIDPREDNNPEKKIIRGDATNMRDLFSDDFFDIATSHDVFEHIPPEKREDFVKESLRVAEDCVILVGPFNTEGVNEAENTAREFYKSLFNEDHPWLIEHEEYGLPDKEKLENLLKSLKCDYINLSNNILDLWITSIFEAFILYKFPNPKDADLVKQFNSYYNNNIFPYDYGGNPYRQIFIISKKGFDPEAKKQIIDLQSGSNDLRINQSQILKEYLEIVKDKIINLEQTDIHNLNNHVHNLELSIQNYKDKEKHFEEDLKQKDEEIDIVKKERDFHGAHAYELQQMLNNSRALKIARIIKLFLKIFSIRGIKFAIKLVKKSVSVLLKQGPITFLRKVKRFIKLKLKGEQNLAQNEYKLWLISHMPSEEEIAKMRKREFAYTPLISICMPVYNIEEKLLREAIDSIIDQTYANWELCITDDASTQSHINKILEEYSKKDERIKVHYSKENQNISLATNKAIDMSSGEFISLMDNDDIIPPHALHEFIKVINKNKDLDLIYSDEDKISLEGEPMEPIFKPDWSPETILSFMYTTHLSLYRSSIVKDIGGLRKGFEGAQDYDLVLRFTEKTSPQKIHHIPKILYRWRKIPGSTAENYSAKPYAKIAARKALEETLTRRKIKAEVEHGLTDPSFRIKRRIIGEPLVSIIIPTKNKANLVKNCIESIESKTSYKNYEIIIVDNNSDEEVSIKYFETLSKKHTLLKYPSEFNFSAINNFAVKHAKGEHVLLLNNDIEVINDEWLEAMLEYSQIPEIGAVGAMLLYRNNTIQHAGVILGIGGCAGHSHKYFPIDDPGYLGRIWIAQNISAVTGACLMIKKSLYEEVGGLDEENLKVAFNDVDFCIKVMDKGYRNIYTPFAKLYHYESISRGLDHQDKAKSERSHRESIYVINKWKNYIENDPYYNPNLTLVHENFSLGD